MLQVRSDALLVSVAAVQGSAFHCKHVIMSHSESCKFDSLEDGDIQLDLDLQSANDVIELELQCVGLIELSYS